LQNNPTEVLLHTSFGFSGGFVSPSLTKIITCAGQTKVLTAIASVSHIYQRIFILTKQFLYLPNNFYIDQRIFIFTKEILNLPKNFYIDQRIFIFTKGFLY